MNAETRRWIYLVSGLAAAIIPILVQVGVIDTGQGESTNTLILTLASLFGAGGAATAARVTHKQIKEGVHDPPLDPIQQINDALPKVLQQQADANATVDMLKQLGGDLVGQVPVVGGIAEQALNSILNPPK